MALPTEATPALDLGIVIAERFRVIDRLGEGGMGEVYIAEQIEIGRRVALKVVRPGLAEHEHMLRRFRSEAHAASRIRSPHVVTVYDFGRDPGTGRLFLAMELLEGETLAARIERVGALSVPEVARIGAEVALGLEAAHRANVVHRDLKPENVFLDTSDRAIVLDFGIARLLDAAPGEGTQITSMGAIVGTPAYISPEAAGRRAIGPSSDLYSLGVMLFEMVTGRLPFDAPDAFALVGMHLRAPPERVRDVYADGRIPEALDDLIDALLEKDPAARPSSAADVVATLRALALAPAPRALVPVEAPAVPVAPGVPRAPTSSARAGILVLTLVSSVAIAGGLAMSSSGGDDDVPAPVIAAPLPPAPIVAPTLPVEAPPPVPSTIRVTIDVHPASAVVELDGTVIDTRVLELAADGAAHEVVARVGARRAVETFVATESGTITLTVPRATRERPTSEARESVSHRPALEYPGGG